MPFIQFPFIEVPKELHKLVGERALRTAKRALVASDQTNCLDPL
jgi:hypothetical protein